jgi:hypothetical protein
MERMKRMGEDGINMGMVKRTVVAQILQMMVINAWWFLPVNSWHQHSPSVLSVPSVDESS